MRIFLSSILFLIISTTHAQHQGIGLRLGEPTGVTYKKYIANSANAVELGLGWVQRGWNNRYYRKSFEKYDRFGGYNYVTHTVESNFYLQGRFLKHYELAVDGVEGNFEWYWGVGVLIKVARINYLYNDDAASTFLYNRRLTDFDIGPEVPFGIEYTFQDSPITLFGEMSLFIEVINRPGIPSFNGALGIRYNFFGNQ